MMAWWQSSRARENKMHDFINPFTIWIRKFYLHWTRFRRVWIRRRAKRSNDTRQRLYFSYFFHFTFHVPCYTHFFLFLKKSKEKKVSLMSSVSRCWSSQSSRKLLSSHGKKFLKILKFSKLVIVTFHKVFCWSEFFYTFFCSLSLSPPSPLCSGLWRDAENDSVEFISTISCEEQSWSSSLLVGMTSTAACVRISDRLKLLL